MNTNPIKYVCIAAAAAAVVIIAAPTPSAEARPSTRNYTCERLKDLIYDRGAIVMNHKSSSLYRRFVHSRNYCRRPYNTTKRFRVPAADGSCYLKICYEFRRFRD